MNVAILLASGQGKRMKANKNKALLTLRGKPLIYYSLKIFQESDKIDSVLVVCKKEERDFFEEIIRRYKFDKVENLIEGGLERQDSAYNAVFYLDESLSSEEKHLVLFHNGANPFVTKDEISRSVKMAKKYGACVVAHPTRDTVKEVDSQGLVIKTPERKRLWNMQTPQTIEFELAKKAFAQAKKENFVGTDDVSLVERLGEPVRVIEGSKFNFKITTPIDLELAEIILSR